MLLAMGPQRSAAHLEAAGAPAVDGVPVDSLHDLAEQHSHLAAAAAAAGSDPSAAAAEALAPPAEHQQQQQHLADHEAAAAAAAGYAAGPPADGYAAHQQEAAYYGGEAGEHYAAAAHAAAGASDVESEEADPNAITGLFIPGSEGAEGGERGWPRAARMGEGGRMARR